MNHFATVVIGAILLSCGLGICLDMVTAHVAVEYFSVHHPTIIETDQPWVLALIWGIGASWWFGAIAGVILATINRCRQEPVEPSRILRWIGIACGVLWILMILILVAIYLIAGMIPVESRRPTFEFDRRLMAVAMAHQYEYLLGGVALMVVAFKTWRTPESNSKIDHLATD